MNRLRYGDGMSRPGEWGCHRCHPTLKTVIDRANSAFSKDSEFFDLVGFATRAAPVPLIV